MFGQHQEKAIVEYVTMGAAGVLAIYMVSMPIVLKIRVNNCLRGIAVSRSRTCSKCEMRSDDGRKCESSWVWSKGLYYINKKHWVPGRMKKRLTGWCPTSCEAYFGLTSRADPEPLKVKINDEVRAVHLLYLDKFASRLSGNKGE